MDNIKLNIKVNTIGMNLSASYGKMKLSIDVFSNGRKTNIRIEDATDHRHVNPFIKWQPNSKRFIYKVGCCFGGQGPNWPEHNDKLKALAKDKAFIEWFVGNVLPVVDKNI